MKKKLKITLIMAIITLLIVVSSINTSDCIDTYADTILKNKISTLLNNCIGEYISNNGEKFKSVATTQYNANGELVCITLDTGIFNSIKTEIEKQILQEIEKIEATPLYVSSGSLTGIKLFAETGPKIKMKIVPLGTLRCDTINKFNSAGINQTAHSLGLSYNIKFRAAFPFGNGDFETSFYVALHETIIIGKVPGVLFS